MLVYRLLCKNCLSKDDVYLADALLMQFCKCVHLYGASAVTPNMHMHCHLREDILNFSTIWKACGPWIQVHLFGLHYMFIPQINRSIDILVNAWNHHCLCTMHNVSPYQLYTSDMLRLQQSHLPASDFFTGVDDHYGVDEDVLLTQIDEETVAAISFQQGWRY